MYSMRETDEQRKARKELCLTEQTPNANGEKGKRDPNNPINQNNTCQILRVSTPYYLKWKWLQVINKRCRVTNYIKKQELSVVFKKQTWSKDI